MTQFVLSTMTGGVRYRAYHPVENNGIPRVAHEVLIHGGANLPTARGGFGELGEDEEGRPLWTPAGVITPIKDEDAEFLRGNRIFKQHMEAGHVKILDQDIRGNHKAVQRHTRDMEQRDGFAQLTPGSVDKRIKVITGKAHEKGDEHRI